MKRILLLMVSMSILTVATNNVKLDIPTSVSENVSVLKHTTLTVKGMVCAFCAKGIEINLLDLESVNNVQVDLNKKTVFVQSHKIIDDNTFHQIIMDAGYNIESIQRATESVKQTNND